MRQGTGDPRVLVLGYAPRLRSPREDTQRSVSAAAAQDYERKFAEFSSTPSSGPRKRGWISSADGSEAVGDAGV